MKKHLLVALLFLTSCGQEENTFVVGTNAEYAPYAYIENNEIVGFDIDVAREVSKRLNKKMKLRDVPFDALIAELTLNRVDFVAAGMTSTEERAKRVAFTKPYYAGDNLVIVSRVDKPIHSLGDLAGKSIVVNEGYTADLFASKISNINLTRLPAPADAFLALKSGRMDAFITAQSTLKKEMNFYTHSLDEVTDGVSLALPKENHALLVEIENALTSMKKDGTIANLKEKWGL